ncbi:MAG: AbgT family transporter [Ilumatobacteraceae bacterium]
MDRPANVDDERAGMVVALDTGPKPGPLDRVLGLIERVRNKVPHPAVLFLGLCVGLIVLSQILAWVGWARPARS